jgi:hypothetical protein
VPHVGSFEVVWALAAVYWAALLAATVAIFVALARGRDRRPSAGEAGTGPLLPPRPKLDLPGSPHAGRPRSCPARSSAPIRSAKKMTDTVNLAGALQFDGGPHVGSYPARLPEGEGRDMDRELEVGNEVRVTTALTPDLMAAGFCRRFSLPAAERSGSVAGGEVGEFLRPFSRGGRGHHSADGTGEAGTRSSNTVVVQEAKLTVSP